jgi:hypothetical protein
MLLQDYSPKYVTGQGRNHDWCIWLQDARNAFYLPRTTYGYHKTKGGAL